MSVSATPRAGIPQPSRPGGRRPGRTGPIVTVVVLGLIVLVGAGLVVVLFTGGTVGTPVHLTANAEAGSSVEVRVPNAALAFEASPDAQVHARAADSRRVDATATNGHVETGTVPTDPSARRTIIAHTTNGDVTVTAG